MIARVWQGVAPESKAIEHLTYIQDEFSKCTAKLQEVAGGRDWFRFWLKGEETPIPARLSNTPACVNSADCRIRMLHNPNRPTRLQSTKSYERARSVSTTSRCNGDLFGCETFFLTFFLFDVPYIYKGSSRRISPRKLPGTDLGQTSWHGPRG